MLISASIFFWTKSYQSGNWRFLTISALFIATASGIRYEAIPVIAIIVFIEGINRRWKHLLLFIPIALSFTIYWFTNNLIYYGDFWHSISGAPLQTPNWEGFLRRIWFFPFLTSALILPAIVILKPDIKKNNYPFWIGITLLCIIIYKAISRSLLLHSRFILTPLLFLIMGIFSGFSKIDLNKKTLVTLILPLLISLILTVGNINPLPRLKNQKFANFISDFESRISPSDHFFIEKVNWENGYFLGLISSQYSNNIFMNKEFTSDEASRAKFLTFANSSANTKYALLKQPHVNWGLELNGEIIFQDQEFSLILIP